MCPPALPVAPVSRPEDQTVHAQLSSNQAATARRPATGGLRCLGPQRASQIGRLARLCTGRKRSTWGNSARQRRAPRNPRSAAQRIEPNDLVREPPQPGRRSRQPPISPRSGRRSPTARQRWRRAAPRPAVVELVQARRDARTALPSAWTCSSASFQRDIGVAVLRAVRDVRGGFAEGQRVHLQVAPRQSRAWCRNRRSSGPSSPDVETGRRASAVRCVPG